MSTRKVSVSSLRSRRKKFHSSIPDTHFFDFTNISGILPDELRKDDGPVFEAITPPNVARFANSWVYYTKKYKLGLTTYLVGGSFPSILIGQKLKDFDFVIAWEDKLSITIGAMKHALAMNLTKEDNELLKNINLKPEIVQFKTYLELHVRVGFYHFLLNKTDWRKKTESELKVDNLCIQRPPKEDENKPWMMNIKFHTRRPDDEFEGLDFVLLRDRTNEEYDIVDYEGPGPDKAHTYQIKLDSRGRETYLNAMYGICKLNKKGYTSEVINYFNDIHQTEREKIEDSIRTWSQYPVKPGIEGYLESPDRLWRCLKHYIKKDMKLCLKHYIKKDMKLTNVLDLFADPLNRSLLIEAYLDTNININGWTSYSGTMDLLYKLINGLTTPLSTATVSSRNMLMVLDLAQSSEERSSLLTTLKLDIRKALSAISKVFVIEGLNDGFELESGYARINFRFIGDSPHNVTLLEEEYLRQVDDDKSMLYQGKVTRKLDQKRTQTALVQLGTGSKVDSSMPGQDSTALEKLKNCIRFIVHNTFLFGFDIINVKICDNDINSITDSIIKYFKDKKEGDDINSKIVSNTIVDAIIKYFKDTHKPFKMILYHNKDTKRCVNDHFKQENTVNRSSRTDDKSQTGYDKNEVFIPDYEIERAIRHILYREPSLVDDITRLKSYAMNSACYKMNTQKQPDKNLGNVNNVVKEACLAVIHKEPTINELEKFQRFKGYIKEKARLMMTSSSIGDSDSEKEKNLKTKFNGDDYIQYCRTALLSSNIDRFLEQKLKEKPDFTNLTDPDKQQTTLEKIKQNIIDNILYNFITEIQINYTRDVKKRLNELRDRIQKLDDTIPPYDELNKVENPYYAMNALWCAGKKEVAAAQKQLVAAEERVVKLEEKLARSEGDAMELQARLSKEKVMTNKLREEVTEKDNAVKQIESHNAEVALMTKFNGNEFIQQCKNVLSSGYDKLSLDKDTLKELVPEHRTFIDSNFNKIRKKIKAQFVSTILQSIVDNTRDIYNNEIKQKIEQQRDGGDSTLFKELEYPFHTVQTVQRKVDVLEWEILYRHAKESSRLDANMYSDALLWKSSQDSNLNKVRTALKKKITVKQVFPNQYIPKWRYRNYNLTDNNKAFANEIYRFENDRIAQNMHVHCFYLNWSTATSSNDTLVKDATDVLPIGNNLSSLHSYSNLFLNCTHPFQGDTCIISRDHECNTPTTIINNYHNPHSTDVHYFRFGGLFGCVDNSSNTILFGIHRSACDIDSYYDELKQIKKAVSTTKMTTKAKETLRLFVNDNKFEKDLDLKLVENIILGCHQNDIGDAHRLLEAVLYDARAPLTSHVPALDPVICSDTCYETIAKKYAQLSNTQLSKQRAHYKSKFNNIVFEWAKQRIKELCQLCCSFSETITNFFKPGTTPYSVILAGDFNYPLTRTYKGQLHQNRWTCQPYFSSHIQMTGEPLWDKQSNKIDGMILLTPLVHNPSLPSIHIRSLLGFPEGIRDFGIKAAKEHHIPDKVYPYPGILNISTFMQERYLTTENIKGYGAKPRNDRELFTNLFNVYIVSPILEVLYKHFYSKNTQIIDLRADNNSPTSVNSSKHTRSSSGTLPKRSRSSPARSVSQRDSKQRVSLRRTSSHALQKHTRKVSAGGSSLPKNTFICFTEVNPFTQYVQKNQFDEHVPENVIRHCLHNIKTNSPKIKNRHVYEIGSATLSKVLVCKSYMTRKEFYTNLINCYHLNVSEFVKQLQPITEKEQRAVIFFYLLGLSSLHNMILDIIKRLYYYLMVSDHYNFLLTPNENGQYSEYGKLEIGSTVIIDGLTQSVELNGKEATIVDYVKMNDMTVEAYDVTILETGERKKLKRANLIRVVTTRHGER